MVNSYKNSYILKTKYFSVVFIFIFLILFHKTTVGIEFIDTTTIDNSCNLKKNLITYSFPAAYCASTVGLYQLWYADYPLSSFHFFNDNKEWLQIDKIGHVYTAYMFREMSYKSAKWGCFSENHALWIGGSAVLLFLTTIEIFDGFSKEWGFSYGDIISNVAGWSLFTTQQHYWNEQRIRMKFSFTNTNYPEYRPNLLGKNKLEQVLKDYNGQTYWFSFNIASFLNNENIPKWLNLAVGYGGDGMTGGYENPEFYNRKPLPHFDRNRQFYISPDIDLTKIPVESKLLKTVLTVLNILKIPMPTIEFTDNKLKFRPLYF